MKYKQDRFDRFLFLIILVIFFIATSVVFMQKTRKYSAQASALRAELAEKETQIKKRTAEINRFMGQREEAIKNRAIIRANARNLEGLSRRIRKLRVTALACERALAELDAGLGNLKNFPDEWSVTVRHTHGQLVSDRVQAENQYRSLVEEYNRKILDGVSASMELDGVGAGVGDITIPLKFSEDYHELPVSIRVDTSRHHRLLGVVMIG